MTSGPSIRLEATAARHAARCGGAITLRGTPRHGCCGDTALVPVAETGAPADRDAWRAQTVDGITVHLDSALGGHEGYLKICASGFGRWQRLFVAGTLTSPRDNDDP